MTNTATELRKAAGELSRLLVKAAEELAEVRQLRLDRHNLNNDKTALSLELQRLQRLIRRHNATCPPQCSPIELSDEPAAESPQRSIVQGAEFVLPRSESETAR